MNDVRHVVFFMAISALLACQALTSLADDYSTMKRNGLFLDVNVHVVDLNGRPIENANVEFLFSVNAKYKTVKTKTDTNGYASARERVNIDVIVNVSASGYYGKSKRETILTLDKSKMKSGAWVPGKMNLDFQLNDVRHPVHALWRFAAANFPATNQMYRLSLSNLITDYSMKYSSNPSEESDFTFVWNYQETNDGYDFSAKLNGEKGGGFQILKKQSGNELSFPYELPEEGYGDYCYCEKAHGTDYFVSRFDPHNEALAFRIPVTNADGSTDFRYGIIEVFTTGFKRKRSEVVFSIHYTLNEKIGDRNSEYVR